MEKKCLGKTEEYVYDISLDGTVVNALGMNVMSNTDGFNFQMPTTFRYTDEHPYISDGGGRNSVKGKAYTKVDADVAEFEDMFMNHAFNGGINKNGLGIDEYCEATINFARKNYADLLSSGKIKMVGNTIKSKKMPIYIEKFLNKAIDLLLHGKGHDFLEYYYDYIEKIYNMQIPLKDIATVGKIKTSIENYKKSCRQLTSSGQKKARQAWYELAIKDKLSVNMGDAIYYINTGTKKKTPDVQRVTQYYYKGKKGEKIYDRFVIDGKEQPLTDRKGNPKTITKYLTNEYNAMKKAKDPSVMLDMGTSRERPMKLYDYIKNKYPEMKIQEEDVVIFNCIRLDNAIVEDEDDHFCDDNFEYNVNKYIDMFNCRIKPLLVCFDKNIRTVVNDKGKEVDNILISNPKDRKIFTEEESKLVSGQPFAIGNQDTYEQLMTIEDKEIKFWLKVGKIPPYVKECGIDWDKTVEDYKERQKQMETEAIQAELNEYQHIIGSLTDSEIDNFVDTGSLPDKLMKIIEVDMNTNDFVSKKYGVILGSIFDILDKSDNFKYTDHEED